MAIGLRYRRQQRRRSFVVRDLGSWSWRRRGQGDVISYRRCHELPHTRRPERHTFISSWFWRPESKMGLWRPKPGCRRAGRSGVPGDTGPQLFPASRVPARSAVCSRHSCPSASAPHFGGKLVTALPTLKQPHHLPPQRALGPVTRHSHRGRDWDGDTFGRRHPADQSASRVQCARTWSVRGTPPSSQWGFPGQPCPPFAGVPKVSPRKYSEAILSAPTWMHWALAECPLWVMARSVTAAPATGRPLGAGSGALPASCHRRHREPSGRHPAVPFMPMRKWGSGK